MSEANTAAQQMANLPPMREALEFLAAVVGADHPEGELGRARKDGNTVRFWVEGPRGRASVVFELAEDFAAEAA